MTFKEFLDHLEGRFHMTPESQPFGWTRYEGDKVSGVHLVFIVREREAKISLWLPTYRGMEIAHHTKDMSTEATSALKGLLETLEEHSDRFSVSDMNLMLDGLETLCVEYQKAFKE